MALMTQERHTTTVGRYLLNRLYKYGVQHIFGVPGDYILKLNKLLEDHPLRFINTTQESTAGYMADLYGRMQGLGATCISYGVGVNIINAVAQAYAESSPVVIISGVAGVKEQANHPHLHHLINRKVLHHYDRTQFEIFRKVTIDQTIVEDPFHAIQDIERVLYHCVRYKKPVYIELPRDIINAKILCGTDSFPEKEEFCDEKALKEAISEVKELLKESQKPCIWIGHEIQRFGLIQPILTFAEKLHIPIVTSLLGKGTISERHPLFVGVYQGEMSLPEVRSFVESCDLMMIFGVLLSDVDTGIFTTHTEHKQRITANAKEIAVNHHRYPGVEFQKFIHSLKELELNLRFRNDYPACIDRNPTLFEVEKAKICSERLFGCLQSHLKSNHIIITDIGDSLLGSTELIVEQNAFHSCAYFANLGFGIPAAITAQLINPKKRVIGIVGDGAFQMTATELSTALRYGSDPILIVINNHGYSTERQIFEGSFNELLNWNYSKIPQLLGGGFGERVTTEEELEITLEKALKQRGEFFIIEVELEQRDLSPTMRRLITIVNSHNCSS